MEIKHSIKLNNQDINRAIAMFIASNGVDIEGKTLDIDVTAGRKGVGNYAHITLTATIENTVESGKTDADRQEACDEEVTPDTTEEEEEAILDAVVKNNPIQTKRELEENNSLFT